jgi:tetratricopeptide (TPR) repeat protein
MSISFRVSISGSCRALAVLAAIQLAGCSSADERAQAYYERGIQFLEQREYVKANLEFRNAVKLKRNLIEAWRGLEQIEERNGNVEGLVRTLRTIVELDSNDFKSRVRLARLLLLANALDESLKVLDAASEAVNQNAGALAIRAAIHLKRNDQIEAVRDAREALSIDPANTEAAIVLAAEKLGQGDADGALLILDRKPFSDIKNVGIQLFKLIVFERKKDLPQFEALLKKLVEAYPQEVNFRRQLISFYISQKRAADAEREVRALAAARPGDAEAVLDVARLVNFLKGPTAAREELLAGISAGGQVFKLQMALADLYFAQGEFESAAKLLENLAKDESSRDQSLAAEIKLAEMQLRRKQVEAAELLITNVLRKDARNGEALKLRATLRMDRGDLEGAVVDLRQALNDQPQSTDLLMQLGAAYERAGSIELAEKQFADATRISRFNPAVTLAYAEFLQRRGSIARAEEIITELTARHPNNLRALSSLADVRLARRNWSGAQELAEHIGRIDGGKVIADRIQAASLAGRAQYSESIPFLENVTDAAPGALQPMVALVNAYVRAQKTDQAVDFLKTALEKNPANAEARVLLGSVYLAKGSQDLAVREFESAIAQQPKNAVGYGALANLYTRQNKYDQALKTVRAGLQEQPANAGLRMALAGILQLTEDYEGAISEYETILKQQPGSLTAANNLASLLSDHRTDKASQERAYALAAILRKSPTPHFKDTLGWVHYQKGEYRAAISLLEEAVAELPETVEVRYHLGMAYLAAGEHAKAAEQLKKALDLAPRSAQLRERISTALSKSGS